MSERAHRLQRIRGPCGNRGIALPVAILALVVVGVLVTGGFFMASQETRASLATERGTRAFYHAEHGLGEAIASGEFWSLSPGQTSTMSGDDWSATITDLGNNLYSIESEGVVRVGQDSESVASRQLTQVVRTRVLDLEVPGALQTYGDTELTGNVLVSGKDEHPPDFDPAERECSLEEDRAAIVHDTASTVDDDGNATIEPDEDEGGVEEDPDMDPEDFDEMFEDLWQNMGDHDPVDANEFSHPEASTTEDGACNTDDPLNWGDRDPDSPCYDHFPVTRVDGDVSVESNSYGQGILIVDGDLDVQGNLDFNGIIVVSGEFVATGDSDVYGGVIAGAGEINEEGVTGSGNAVVQRSSCAQQMARERAFSHPVPLARRDWSDVTAIRY